MLPAALPTAQGRRLALGCAGVAVVAVALITLSAPDLPASWITIVQAGHVGAQHQQFRFGEYGDVCGQRVVVADAQLVDRD